MRIPDDRANRRPIDLVWQSGFHLTWFSTVLPFFMAMTFLVQKYLRTGDQEVPRILGASLVGSVLGLFFMIVPGFVTALIIVPFVLSSRRLIAYASISVGIPALVWFLVPFREPFYGADVIVIALLTAGCVLLTCLLYRRIGIIR